MCGPEAPPKQSTGMESSCECAAIASNSPKQKAADSGLFTSDEFRMYCMKVLPCSKRFVHDWPSCPFAHPGEKAKRRDPRTHQYDCEMCPAVLKGETCELGVSCPHSHHVFESWLHPQKYRTLLCKDGDQCHREVCFFAHGSKQLRTPEPSYRASQQRMEAGLKQRNGSAQRSHLSSSRNGSGNYAQQLDGHLSSSRHGSGNYAQQLVAGSGSNLVNGNSSSSASTNLSPSAVQQMQAQKYPDFAAPACDPGMMQLRGAGMGGQADAFVGPAQGGDLQQVLHSLMAEVSASKQEAAQHIHAAEAAQQKLQLLQHLLGCNPAQDACSPRALGAAAVRAGSSLSMASGPSPVAPGWQVHGPAAQQLPPQGLNLHQLQALQQMLAYDGVYPRRHSLDEAFLRRVQNLAAGGGAGFVGCGRPGTLWAQGSSSSALPGLAAVTEGIAMGNAPDGSAAADIQALVAALAASGLPSNSSGNAAGLGSMHAGGLPSNSMMLGGPAGAGATGGLAVPVGNGWMGDNGLTPWGQPGITWHAGGAPPAGAFHSAPNLPPIPMAPQAISDGVSSFSMMHLQSQSDYLMQLQAMVQDSNAGLAGLGCAAAPRPVRASFDTAAAYLPSMPGNLLAAMSQGLPQAEVAGCADDLAGVSGGSSGSCKIQQEAPAAVPDTLVNNPIGGAKQMGWF